MSSLEDLVFNLMIMTTFHVFVPPPLYMYVVVGSQFLLNLKWFIPLHNLNHQFIIMIMPY